jgi:predicted nucleic acid-binding protein
MSGRHNAEIKEYSTPQVGEELILADTSIWIDHLRAGNKEMGKQLNQGHIVIHPSIIAELALGLLEKRTLEKRTLEKRTLEERTKTLALLDWLPQVRVAQLSEVRQMIEARRLYSLGIGLTDAHLIASVFINSSTLLWTRDKRLRKAAEDLGIQASLP